MKRLEATKVTVRTVNKEVFVLVVYCFEGLGKIF